MVAIIELARTESRNPEVPEWLRDDYRIDEAIRELQWAIQLKPAEPWPYSTLALARWKHREIVAAARNLGTSIFLYLKRGLSKQ